MRITGLLLKAKTGRYLMRNSGGLDANIHPKRDDEYWTFS